MSTPLALLERLEARAALAPDAPAIVETGARGATTASRAEVAAHARALAHGFVAAGLAPGDHVLFAVRPGIDAVALMIAIVEAGGVIVPASIGTGDRLFAAQMAAVAPRWIVAESLLLAAGSSGIVRRLLARAGAALPSLRGLRDARFVRVGPPVPWGPATTSVVRLATLGARALDAGQRLPTVAASAPALVVFTSGTTGAPKGVVHLQAGLRATLDVVAADLGIAEGDVLYARELHLILPALLAGARVVVSRRTRFSAAHAVGDLVRHRVSHMFGVTADCQALVDHLAPRQATLRATLRRVLVGAAPVRAGFLARLRAVLPAGARTHCVYGMTEMLPVASVELEAKIAYDGEGDLVGVPMPGVTARIADDGELLLRGPHLFARHLGGPAVTEHATGDLARIDDAGRIVLLGRRKDMIIRREHNIYPELHEPVIETIDGVRRCAMVGVYDDDAADERVVLVVEPERAAAGDDDAAFTARLHRALREGPGRIDAAAQPDLIVLLHAIPEHGRSRKVDKRALRALARERLRCASR